MSADAVTLWLVIIGMGAITFALRASFMVLPPSIEIPPLLKRGLRFVPAAVLTAIWAPELLLQKGVLHLALDNDRLLAGAVAIAVAWRFRQTYLTIAAGIVALHAADWLIRELRATPLL